MSIFPYYFFHIDPRTREQEWHRLAQLNYKLLFRERQAVLLVPQMGRRSLDYYQYCLGLHFANNSATQFILLGGVRHWRVKCPIQEHSTCSDSDKASKGDIWEHQTITPFTLDFTISVISQQHTRLPPPLHGSCQPTMMRTHNNQLSCERRHSEEA